MNLKNNYQSNNQQQVEKGIIQKKRSLFLHYLHWKILEGLVLLHQDSLWWQSQLTRKDFQREKSFQGSQCIEKEFWKKFKNSKKRFSFFHFFIFHLNEFPIYFLLKKIKFINLFFLTVSNKLFNIFWLSISIFIIKMHWFFNFKSFSFISKK